MSKHRPMTEGVVEESAGKILIRNLKPAVITKLKALADQNQRSLESECRFAINEWARTGGRRVDTPDIVLLDIKLVTFDCKAVLRSTIETFDNIVLDDDDRYCVTIQIAALAKTGNSPANCLLNTLIGN